MQASIDAACRRLDVQRHVAEVEERGYTVVPGAIPASLCARARAHMDALLAPPAPEGGGSEGCGHPFPGPIMAELCSAPGVLAMSSALMDAPVEEMRLLEQVLIRTDPQSAQSVLDTPDTSMEERGWHCDQIFTPAAFHGRPRQNYFQMFAVFNDVLPGAACTCVVPFSHHKTLAAAASVAASDKFASPGEERALTKKIVASPRDYGIDTSQGIELPAAAGSLVIFCPFTLHTGSANRGKHARYACVQSYYHQSDSTQLHQILAESRYLQGFHRDMHRTIAPELRQLLGGKGLWGPAMKQELAQFNDRGFFCNRTPLIPQETLEKMTKRQREIEPAWSATDYPPGFDRTAVRLLLVLKAGGEELLTLLEDGPTLKLASALLDGGEERLSLTEPSALSRDGGISTLVIEACGIGEWTDEPTARQDEVEWCSDGECQGRPTVVAFRCAIDSAQAVDTDDTAALRLLTGRPRQEVEKELRAFGVAQHPDEAKAPLNTSTTLVWNPATWHTTTVNDDAGSCWTVGWSYRRREAGRRAPNSEAVKWVFAGEWEGWPESRKRLWGLDAGPQTGSKL
jgi:ectoine hydroxylase-related dioxygenase (phytanoyl-CoA dioxygenase family)